MTRTGQAAADYALARVGTTMPDAGLCLQFTRENYPVAAVYASAIDAWNATAYPHPGDDDPPVGVPVWFDGHPIYGHVCITVGGGRYVSTYNDEIRLYDTRPDATFGRYMGWSEDLNGVTIWEDDDMPSAEEIAREVWNYARSAGGGLDAYDALIWIQDRIGGNASSEALAPKINRVLDRLGGDDDDPSVRADLSEIQRDLTRILEILEGAT